MRSTLTAMTVRHFRYLAVAEAASFLILLLVAMPLKYTEVTEAGVQIMGPIHGILFIAYVAFAIAVKETAGWTLTQTFWILVGAVVPFGGFVVDWWLVKREREGLTQAA